MPERPTGRTPSLSSDDSEFIDLADIEMILLRSPSAIDDCFRVSGSTVDEAAQALISAIKNSHQDLQTVFPPSAHVRSSDGQDLSLSNILLYRTWLFDACV
jgi:hypothetical protein